MSTAYHPGRSVFRDGYTPNELADIVHQVRDSNPQDITTIMSSVHEWPLGGYALHQFKAEVRRQLQGEARVAVSTLPRPRWNCVDGDGPHYLGAEGCLWCGRTHAEIADSDNPAGGAR